MLELRESKPGELAAFSAMEQDVDTIAYIKPGTPQQHLAEFNREDVVYLSIYENQKLAGFFLLCLDADGNSVEFRRIVIADKGNGLGQQAIPAMERYCRERLQRRRIWLDVFDFNHCGQHVYHKLGYRQFGRACFEGKPLLCYQKIIDGEHVDS